MTESKSSRSHDQRTGSSHGPQSADDVAEVRRHFDQAVNMTAGQLQKWLETEDSRRVGFKGAAGGESVGHRSGRRIIRLLAKKNADLTPGDVDHMRKVSGYVHRHLAQRPDGKITDTPWRYSLMNWGHDPARPGR